MTYKIVSLLIPLVISSIVNPPIGFNYDRENAVSTPFSLKPIDSSTFPINNNDYFSCSSLGPLSLKTVTNNVTVSFTYELRSISSQYIIERVRLLNSSNTVVASSSKQSLYYQKGTRNTVSFVLPIRDHLTRNGLTLKFEIVNESTFAILKAYSSTFYPSSDATISWVSLKQNAYTSKTLGYYSKDSQMAPLIETLDFTHFGDFLDIDYYYRLEINKNLIGYPNDCTFRYTSAYLRFNDQDRLFPYLSHDGAGDVNIPLSMTRSGNNIYLKYKNTFYINKRTLQISDTYRNGFALTKDFYLPVNGRSKFNGKQLYFALEGFGLDNINTTIPLKYQANKAIVGVCKDGDYCVIGGNR